MLKIYEVLIFPIIWYGWTFGLSHQEGDSLRIFRKGCGVEYLTKVGGK